MIAVYIILSIVLTLLVVAFVLPTAFKYQSEIVINKPKAEVFEYLKSLKNQNNWSVWNQLDPNMKQEYMGTDSTVGFTYTWEGNSKVGKGAQEIKKIVEGENIEVELRFEKPFKMTNTGFLITSVVDNNKTKVIWGFSGNSSRPMNVFSAMMKGAILKDFDKGLANLKVQLEK